VDVTARQTYTTHPGSQLLFPTLCRGTAPITAVDAPDTNTIATGTRCGLMMPRRRTTRAQERAKRIDDERARNQERREDPGNDCDDAYFPSRPRPPGDDDTPPFEGPWALTLSRGDGEQTPFAGHALELVSATVVELQA
jgi:hypothetical protein